MCYYPTPTLHLNLALTGDGAFLFSLKKTHSVWFISVLNYGDTENVLINHLLLVIAVSYPCYYTNLCPHKPHKHAHTHTHTPHTPHTHTHTHTHTPDLSSKSGSPSSERINVHLLVARGNDTSPEISRVFSHTISHFTSFHSDLFNYIFKYPVIWRIQILSEMFLYLAHAIHVCIFFYYIILNIHIGIYCHSLMGKLFYQREKCNKHTRLLFVHVIYWMCGRCVDRRRVFHRLLCFY